MSALDVVTRSRLPGCAPDSNSVAVSATAKKFALGIFQRRVRDYVGGYTSD